MAKISFTSGRVQDFKCPPDKQQAFLWDSVTEGLGLRATAGSKNYVFQGKLAGQAIRIKIGGLDRCTIDDARKEARTCSGLTEYRGNLARPVTLGRLT